MIILALALLAVLVWLVVLFRGLVTLRKQVSDSFQQIDVQLKRRYELIPGLIDSMKGEMKFELSTLEKALQACAEAVAADASGNMKEMTAKEEALDRAMEKLFALAENYPNLNSNGAVRRLMEELAGAETRLGFARQLYNETAARFNVQRRSFPNNVLASVMGFAPPEPFELPKEPEGREVRKADLAKR